MVRRGRQSWPTATLDDLVDVSQAERSDLGWTRRIATHAGTRYVAVGAASFVLDFGVLAFVHEMLRATLWVSTTAGFAAALLFNFTTQRSVTFRVRGGLHTHLLRYVVVLGINYSLTVVLVLTAQAVGIGYAAGKVVATALLGFTTFFAYRHWVFASTQSQPAVHDVACEPPGMLDARTS